MQINIILENDFFSIRKDYHYQLQSAIYRKLDEINLSDFWHNQGFGEINKFKGFLFTPPNGNVVYGEDDIVIKGDIELSVRSPRFEFCDGIQRSLEKNPTIKLFDRTFPVIGASLNNIHINENKSIFYTLAPVVVHKRDEEGKRHYLSPKNPEFRPMLERNLARKYEAFFSKEAPKFEIIPLGEHRKIEINYKKGWITGYVGQYCILGNYEIQELAYNAGLGTKNAEGFGVLDIK